MSWLGKALAGIILSIQSLLGFHVGALNQQDTNQGPPGPNSTVKVSATSGIYGTVSITTGNCMPTVTIPGEKTTSTCVTRPKSVHISAYPLISTADYVSIDQPDTVYFYIGAALRSPLFAAPLEICFSTDQSSATIVFGDGTSAPISNTNKELAPCNGQVMHEYTQPGHYAVELRDANGKLLHKGVVNVLAKGISPVGHATSNDAGSYALELSPGIYTILLSESNSPYEFIWDYMIMVGENSMRHDIKLNAAVW